MKIRALGADGIWEKEGSCANFFLRKISRALLTYSAVWILDEFASEKTEHMLYVWDLDVDHILSANTSAMPAVVPDFDEIIETPLLAVDVVSCNCSNFPNTDKVLLPPLGFK